MNLAYTLLFVHEPSVIFARPRSLFRIFEQHTSNVNDRFVYE